MGYSRSAVPAIAQRCDQIVDRLALHLVRARGTRSSPHLPRTHGNWPASSPERLPVLDYFSSATCTFSEPSTVRILDRSASALLAASTEPSTLART